MRHALLSVTLAASLMAAPALAIQNETPSRPQTRDAARAERRPEAPLSGPRVRLTEAPGVYMSFGGEGGPRMFRANLRVYANVLRQMELTEDQRRQADLIGAEYAQALREHENLHGPEQRRLQQRLSRLQGAPDRPARDAAESDRAPRRREAVENQPSDEREPEVRSNERPNVPPRDTGVPPRRPRAEAREQANPPESGESMGGVPEIMARLAEIRRAIPPQEPYLLRLHDLLTPEQKQEFERRLIEQVRAQGEAQMQRRLAAAGGDAPAAEEPGGMRMMEGMIRTEDGGVVIDESQFTPEMRERLRRMRQERRRMLENRDQINPQPPSPEEIEFESETPRSRATDRRPERDEG